MKKLGWNAATIACLVMLACGKERAASPPCEGADNPVLTVPNVAYERDAADRLDLYLPWHRAGEPLLIFVHGGGWSSGNKREYGHVGRFFARCGIAFANLDYPLVPRVRPEAQAAAVLDAARWLADRAAIYGYAGDRSFLIGHSAGAQIVAFAALGSTFVRLRHNANLQGVIALDGFGYSPPSQSELAHLPGNLGAAYRLAFGPNAAAWERYDVERSAPKGAPPFLIVHGADDTIAPQADSSALAQALERAGDRVAYLQPARRDHTTVLSSIVRDPADPTGVAIERFIFTGQP